MKEIDGRGVERDRLVEEVRQAILKGERELIVHAEDMATVGELKELADGVDFALAISGLEGHYMLVMAGEEEPEEAPKGENGVTTSVATSDKTTRPQSVDGFSGWALLVGRDVLGSGDRKLGGRLMEAYFEALAGGEDGPAAVVLVNDGVKLAGPDERIAGCLVRLAERGCRVLVCKTSLEFYGMKDRLRVGEAKDMAELVAELARWSKVVTL